MNLLHSYQSVLRETDESKKLRHQMFLGSRLGDGYFQKTHRNIYKYRESHSINELEYAKWKYFILQSKALLVMLYFLHISDFFDLLANTSYIALNSLLSKLLTSILYWFVLTRFEYSSRWGFTHTVLPCELPNPLAFLL